jgi:cytoskeletal protein RodZ
MDASAIRGTGLENGDLPFAQESCVGSILRDTRIRAGLELDDVSAELKISTQYLLAIEEMDRDALPSRAYALGFVRCYAVHLGLNAPAMVEQFEAGGCIQKPRHQDLSARSAPFWLDFSLPKGAGIAVAVVGILGLAAWFGNRTETAIHVIPPVPELLESWSRSNELGNVPAIRQQPAIQAKIEPGDG